VTARAGARGLPPALVRGLPRRSISGIQPRRPALPRIMAAPPALSSELVPAPARRRRAVDALRGLVMVVMALDHARDFLGEHHFDAIDLGQTTPAVFASRWITHFCAPTFFLLAGVSAFLAIQSGRRSAADTARFLAVRGLALIVVEQTALRCLGWYFHFDYHFMNAGVLYGLGGAMVLLAGAVWLPPAVSLAIGPAIQPGGAGGTLWALLAQSRDFEPVTGYHFYVSYPPIPWFGAMALGYGLAARAYPDPAAPARLRWLAGLGAAFLLGFCVLRVANLADPTPWSAQPRSLFTALSFVNLSKYPPSTPYLLLTLGVALLALTGFERRRRPGGVLEDFGRVPLFFYLLHIPLTHAIAVVYSYAAFGAAPWLLSGPVIFWDVALPGSPPSYGLPIAGVWTAWLAIVAVLYPLCRWYGARKRF
jgi:uncharacterized membrane protein